MSDNESENIVETGLQGNSLELDLFTFNYAHYIHHGFQLAHNTPVRSRDNLLRSFPVCLVNTWNNLPLDILSTSPRHKHLHTFKVQVNRFLLSN